MSLSIHLCESKQKNPPILQVWVSQTPHLLEKHDLTADFKVFKCYFKWIFCMVLT